MTNYPEGMVDKLVNQVVGVKHRTEDGRIAVIERVNSSHPHMEVGLFVNYKNTADNEWITPEQLAQRLDSEQWTIWESEDL